MDMRIQTLINSGSAWRLEGYIGRQCMGAIRDGQAILGEKGHFDYYGNYVPSRREVNRGTKGSVQYANKMRARFGLRPLRAIDFDNGHGSFGLDEY